MGSFEAEIYFISFMNYCLIVTRVLEGVRVCKIEHKSASF